MSFQQKVLFYSPKGGVGTSSLTALLGWHAARRGFHTVAVSIDFTGGILRILRGFDRMFRRDDLYEVEPRLQVVWAPDEMPDLASFPFAVAPELILVDMKYGGERELVEPFDLHLMPIHAGPSLDILYRGPDMQAVKARKRCLVLNKQGYFVHDRPRARRFAEESWGTIHPIDIPDAGSIDQALQESRCPWDSPFKDSWSSRQLRLWADEILKDLFPQKMAELTCERPQDPATNVRGSSQGSFLSDVAFKRTFLELVTRGTEKKIREAGVPTKRAASASVAEARSPEAKPTAESLKSQADEPQDRTYVKCRVRSAACIIGGLRSVEAFTYRLKDTQGRTFPPEGQPGFNANWPIEPPIAPPGRYSILFQDRAGKSVPCSFGSIGSIELDSCGFMKRTKGLVDPVHQKGP